MNLDFLRPLLHSPGAWVSVYLDATQTGENADHEVGPAPTSTPDPSSTDMLWIAPDDPTLIAVDDHVLREAGVGDPRKVRADAALARAIAGTGARLVLVAPGEVPLEHGIGAVLRYADGSSAAD